MGPTIIHSMNKKLYFHEKKVLAVMDKISTNITSHLKLLSIKKTTTYDVGKPSPHFGQALKCGRLKSVKGIHYMH